MCSRLTTPPSMGPMVLPKPQPRESMAMPRACSVGEQLSASSVLIALHVHEWVNASAGVRVLSQVRASG